MVSFKCQGWDRHKLAGRSRAGDAGAAWPIAGTAPKDADIIVSTIGRLGQNGISFLNRATSSAGSALLAAGQPSCSAGSSLSRGPLTWAQSPSTDDYGCASGTRTRIALSTRTISLENFSFPTFRMAS